MGAEQAIVEVLGASGGPVGLGFVVDGGFVVTCAHVVNGALDREPRDATPPPDAEVRLRFPFAEGKPERIAAVRHWAPDPAGEFDLADLAGLAATEELPADVEACVLAAPERLADQRVHLYGPVSGRVDGGIVPGRLVGPLPNGRLQLNQDVVGTFRAVPGFSGGPAWLVDEPGVIAGMLVAVAIPDDARDAYLLSVERLATLWPEQLQTTHVGRALEQVFLETLLDSADLTTLFVPPIGSVALERIFVAPFVVPYAGAEADPPAAEEESAHDAVARFARSVVVAGPGMGKSTFLRALTLELASGTTPGTYPMLISLSAYVAHHGQRDLLSFGLQDRYGGILQRDELDLLDDTARAWNREGRLLFLLDGLDEVPEDRRRLLLEEIGRVKRFVVASRPLSRIALNQDEGATLALSPLGDASIARFVRNWAAGTSKESFPVDQVLDRLRTDARLRDLARTPQLLGLICWLIGRRPDHLPSTRTELLAKAVVELIRSAVERGDVPPEDAERLSLRLRGFLRALALVRLESTDEASLRFSQEEFAEFAETFAGAPDAFKLTRLARLSGLIVASPGSDDDLQFLHLVFQEFLAAEGLVRSDDLAAAVDRMKLQRDCEESLRMACAMFSGTNSDDKLSVVLARILDKADTDVFRLNWQLGARCLAEIADADRRFGPVVDEVARTLLDCASEWWARDGFAEAISELRTPRTRDVLAAALHDEDRYVRWAAAEGLARMADPASLPAILGAAADEPWPPVLASLISGIGRIGDREALPLLMQLADSGLSDWGRPELGAALGRLNAIEELESLLPRGGEVVSDLVVPSLQHLPPDLARRLMVALSDLGYGVTYSSQDPYAAPDQSLDDIDELAASSETDDQLAAIKALGERPEWGLWQRLLNLLLAEDNGVAEAAARSLANWGGDREALDDAVRYLLSFMVQPDDHEAAAIALGSLWICADSRSVVEESGGSVFSELLSDADLDALALLVTADDAADRAVSHWVLSYFDYFTGYTQDTLLAALGDDSALVRWVATWSVGRRREDGAVPLLMAGLDSEEVNEIRVETVRSLGLLQAAQAASVLVPYLTDEDEELRQATAEALGRLEDASVGPALIAALQDGESAVRGAAAIALGKAGGSSSGAALVAHLGVERDPYVLLATIESLADLDAPTSLDAIAGCLDVDRVDVRVAAMEAIGRIGDASQGPRLLAQLSDEQSEEGIEACAEAIGRVADGSTVLAAAQHLVASGDLEQMVNLAAGVAHRGDAEIAAPVADLFRSHGVRVVFARHAVELQQEDFTVSRIWTWPDEVDVESPDWVDRWDAVMLWSESKDPSIIAGLANLLRDEEPHVARAAAHALRSIAREASMEEVVWSAIGSATQAALADNTFEQMVSGLAGSGSDWVWVMARIELLGPLLQAYLGGQQSVRPVLWEIGARYDIRMLDDGQVITPAGEVRGCDEAIALLNRLTST